MRKEFDMLDTVLSILTDYTIMLPIIVAILLTLIGALILSCNKDNDEKLPTITKKEEKPVEFTQFSKNESGYRP